MNRSIRLLRFSGSNLEAEWTSSEHAIPKQKTLTSQSNGGPKLNEHFSKLNEHFSAQTIWIFCAHPSQCWAGLMNTSRRLCVQVVERRPQRLTEVQSLNVPERRSDNSVALIRQVAEPIKKCKFSETVKRRMWNFFNLSIVAILADSLPIVPICSSLRAFFSEESSEKNLLPVLE